MMRPQPPVPVPDPDLEKYDRLLDKIMEIQHPESAKPKEALVTPQHPVPDTLAAIQAQIDADAALVSGETIALRLEEPLRIEGKQVDSSTLVYGMVNLQGERLHIQIRSILIGRKILAVHLEAYDQDGQLGIYVPGSLERDVAKESTEGSIGTLNMDLADPGLGAQAANAGLQAAKSLLSRKVRQVRVFVRAGYQVFIK
jgi:conjugative transposon TraM protein